MTVRASSHGAERGRELIPGVTRRAGVRQRDIRLRHIERGFTQEDRRGGDARRPDGLSAF